MKTVTKPKQAASARQLDRWQLAVQAAIHALDMAHDRQCRRRLVMLYRSMQKAERR
jgi:hypothetical protein